LRLNQLAFEPPSFCQVTTVGNEVCDLARGIPNRADALFGVIEFPIFVAIDEYTAIDLSGK